MPALSALLRTFSFHFSLLFFHVGSQAAAASYVVYPISDIGRCRKCWKYVSCTRWSAMEKDFELILTVKMETRHPVGEHLVVNFRRSVIDAWLWRPEVAGPGNFVSNFCVLGKKTTPYGNFFKILFRKFSPPHGIDGVVFNRRKIYPTGNRWNRALFTGQKKTKFRLPLKLSLLRGSRPKSARASRQQCAHSAPDFIQIGSLSAEL